VDGRGAPEELARIGQRGTIVKVGLDPIFGNKFHVKWDDPVLVSFPSDVPEWGLEQMPVVERLAELDE